MNTFQRLAIRALGLNAAKAVPLSSVSRSLFDSWGWSQTDTDGTSSYSDTPTGYLSAVKSNVWAANCMRVRASIVAQTPMKLYRYSDDGEDREEVADHPVIELLEQVNPVRDNLSTFRRAIEEQLTIHGTAYVLKVRGTGGKPAELYWLPANLIDPITDPTRFVSGYRWLPDGRIYPAEDVMRIWYQSPDGSARALSPTTTALRYINAYNNADTAAEAIDKRGGQGGGIVMYDSMVLPVDFARMSEQWDRKRFDPKKAGMDLHMPPGTDYKSGALTAQQMQREERMLRLGKNIMAAYRVPPAMAGDMSDASVLANAAAQSRALWELFALDELKFIEESFNNELLWRDWPETRDVLYFEHDLSDVTALQEDATARAERAILLVQGGVASINEGREIVDLEPVDDEQADAVTIVKEAKPEPAAPAQPIPPEPDLPEPPAARASLTPIFDWVGMTATTTAGDDIGVIEKIHRKPDAVVIIAGKAYPAEDILVRLPNG